MYIKFQLNNPLIWHKLIYEKENIEVQNLYQKKMASEKPLFATWLAKFTSLLYLTENFLVWTEKGFMGGEIRTCVVDR